MNKDRDIKSQYHVRSAASKEIHLHPSVRARRGLPSEAIRDPQKQSKTHEFILLISSLSYSFLFSSHSILLYSILFYLSYLNGKVHGHGPLARSAIGPTPCANWQTCSLNAAMTCYDFKKRSSMHLLENDFLLFQGRDHIFHQDVADSILQKLGLRCCLSILFQVVASDFWQGSKIICVICFPFILQVPFGGAKR